MPTKLKNLKITSTDLVEQGANPDAHIRLFKRKDVSDNDIPQTLLQKCLAAIIGVFGKSNIVENEEPVAKDATTFNENVDRERLHELTREMFDFCYALSDSLSSIVCDGELNEEEKRDMMFTSLDEFAETIRTSTPLWAVGRCAGGGNVSKLTKSKAQQAAFDSLWEGITKEMDDSTLQTENEPNDGDTKSEIVIQKEETETMKIDKSKMSAAELATLAEFENKYGLEEETSASAPKGDVTKSADVDGATGTAPEIHPEVKKALTDFEAVSKAQTAKIEELTKSLEMAGLTAVTKKYEIIGKKTDELAQKLYGLKKAGGTAYDDYVALLDEQVTLVEKGGMFSEIGKGTSGSPGVNDELGIKAAEIVKSNTGMSTAAAIAKAFEDNPELAVQYEKDYMTGRA